ncbi:ABC transporter ATP-binding protein [Oceanivirga salmonicida]|uniref:ABC transporter ATP-binding protein n=1 Tax=Oceanivirga salmonicida TaxID=1769291 RepID=UPI00083468BE|nr:ABC transporter ATP-binding protein [Oceanivirga salmonicida]
MNISNKVKLSVKNISYTFNKNEEVLKDICFDIKEYKTVAIIGPSGVGKTTLFNIIAGLLEANNGQVFLENEDITGITSKVSYMLQKDLLLPFRTVFENISLPLEIKGHKKEYIKENIEKHLDEFGLKGLEHKYPKELSGGQRQRAALLRTYMFSNEVILLDEAFSSLDYITKNKMYNWFNNLKNELKLTCLLITHDIDEALFLADKICILKGKPATLKYEFNIPKDKDILSPEVIEIKKEILKILSE